MGMDGSDGREEKGSERREKNERGCETHDGLAQENEERSSRCMGKRKRWWGVWKADVGLNMF